MACFNDFTTPDDEKEREDKICHDSIPIVALLIPPRSLYIMEGDARLRTLHGIMRAPDAVGLGEPMFVSKAGAQKQFRGINPNVRFVFTLREGRLPPSALKNLKELLGEDIFEEYTAPPKKTYRGIAAGDMEAPRRNYKGGPYKVLDIRNNLVVLNKYTHTHTHLNTLEHKHTNKRQHTHTHTHKTHTHTHKTHTQSGCKENIGLRHWKQETTYWSD